MNDKTVPLINLASFGHNAEDTERIADQVRTACQDIGFFLVSGHSVSETLVKNVYASAKEFFRLPLAVKERSLGARESNRGYSRLGHNSFAKTLGNRSAPPDLHEGFTTGAEVDHSDSYYSSGLGPMLFVPNIWPEQPASLQRLTIEYYEAMWGLTHLLGRVFALALGLEEGFFEPKLARGFANLRFNYYPEQELAPKPGQLRAGEHTDYGMLTILKVEDAPGGLQVRDRSGVWHDVGYVEGAFVVNIGDLMARWTNEEWVSTLHRVVNPPRDAALGSSRLSIPFFAYPSYDSVIECLARFSGSDKAAKYPPITAGEYWQMKFRTALATPT